MLFSWLQIVGTSKIAFVASWLKVFARRSLYSGFECCCAKGQQPIWAMGFVGLGLEGWDGHVYLTKNDTMVGTRCKCFLCGFGYAIATEDVFAWVTRISILVPDALPSRRFVRIIFGFKDIIKKLGFFLCVWQYSKKHVGWGFCLCRAGLWYPDHYFFGSQMPSPEQKALGELG